MTSILCLDSNGIYLDINSYFAFKINKFEITEYSDKILSEHGDLLCGLHLVLAASYYSLKYIVLFISKLEDEYEIIPKFVNLRIDNYQTLNATILADLLDYYKDFDINFNIICNDNINPIKALIDYVLFHESYGRLNVGLCLDLEKLNPNLWLNKEVQDSMGNYIQSIYYDNILQIK